MNQMLFLVHVLTLAAATDCDPENGNCDDPTSMKVSMLQKKQVNEHSVHGETVSSLEERKAKMIAELESLDSQIAALEEQENEEEELHEEENYQATEGTQWCSPELIGRRRTDPSTDGGPCSCRRRDGMSSTGMYGCNGNSMEYYGGRDADARRRSTPTPTMPPCNVANCAACHPGFPDSCKNCQASYQAVADGDSWKCKSCSSLTCSSFTTEFGCTSETCSEFSCEWTGTACQDPSLTECPWVGRRREDPSTNGGRCSCRRRDGMSSTGMYGCNGNSMEYYGGQDADARRRRSTPTPTMPPIGWATWPNTNCYTYTDGDGSYHGAANIGDAQGNIGLDACKSKCLSTNPCTCITVGQKGDCYLRTSCKRQYCDYDSTGYWTTYQGHP